MTLASPKYLVQKNHLRNGTTVVQDTVLTLWKLRSAWRKWRLLFSYRFQLTSNVHVLYSLDFNWIGNSNAFLWNCNVSRIMMKLEQLSIFLTSLKQLAVAFISLFLWSLHSISERPTKSWVNVTSNVIFSSKFLPLDNPFHLNHHCSHVPHHISRN